MRHSLNFETMIAFLSPDLQGSGGYSYDPGVRPSVDKACALNNLNTLGDILILFGRLVYQVKKVCRMQG